MDRHFPEITSRIENKIRNELPMLNIIVSSHKYPHAGREYDSISLIEDDRRLMYLSIEGRSNKFIEFDFFIRDWDLYKLCGEFPRWQKNEEVAVDSFIKVAKANMKKVLNGIENIKKEN